MCGIAGVVAPKLSPEERWYLARDLLWESQWRGTDATGIGFHSEDGAPVVVKADEEASKFIHSEAFNDLRFKLPATFILHTRAMTQGSQKFNRNNHPIYSKRSGLILVHNGGVVDDEWRAQDESGENPFMLEPFDGEVDSEALLRLVETMRHIPRLPDGSVDPDVVRATPKAEWRPSVSWMDAIDDGMFNMRGAFACAMLVPDEKDTVYLWRYTSPMYLAYLPEMEAIVWASTKAIFTDAVSYEDTLFNMFPQKITPEFLGVEVEDKALLRLTYTDEEGFNFTRGKIDPPAYNRTKVNVTPLGGKPTQVTK